MTTHHALTTHIYQNILGERLKREGRCKEKWANTFSSGGFPGTEPFQRIQDDIYERSQRLSQSARQPTRPAGARRVDSADAHPPSYRGSPPGWQNLTPVKWDRGGLEGWHGPKTPAAPSSPRQVAGGQSSAILPTSPSPNPY